MKFTKRMRKIWIILQYYRDQRRRRDENGGGVDSDPPLELVFFDPAKKGANAVLLDSGLTLSTSSTTAQALSNIGYSVGKHYFEVEVIAKISSISIGISAIGTDYNSDVGQENKEIGLHSNGSSYINGSFGGINGASYTTGKTIGCLLDCDTRELLWRIDNAPFSMTPAVYADGNGDMFAAASVTGSNDIVKACFNEASFKYPVPDGYTAWGAAP